MPKPNLQKKVRIKVPGTVGSVSGLYIVPDKSKSVMLLAHGAGAGMNHPFMAELSERLAEKNIATFRFNFPYMESGKRRPDSPAIAHQTIAAALDHAKNQLPQVQIFLSGKSFGGRMSSQFLSTNPDAGVMGIVFFGFPLHAPGDPGTDRAEHLKKIDHPMLFLSGMRDEFARMDLLKKVVNKLPSAALVTIEGANHGFKAGKTDVIRLLAAHTDSWIKDIQSS